MKYTVLWLPDAEAEIARLWLDADSRAAVTAAADAIDQTLAEAPLQAGESRDGEKRILLIRPLGVTYIVHETSKVVIVGRVWRTGPRSS